MITSALRTAVAMLTTLDPRDLATRGYEVVFRVFFPSNNVFLLMCYLRLLFVVDQ